MADDPIVISSGAVITPESVMSRNFTAAFRGYHPVEVRQFLKRVGDELTANAGREAALQRALEEALARAAHPDLDEATVTALLGEHATRLIATARETAASITTAAEAEAESTVADARGRAARLLHEAEGCLARRTAEADAAAAGVQKAADAEARVLRNQAGAEAEAVVEAARVEGRQMVVEARALRERMLDDLARRRRAGQLQVDQFRAARDRLLAAYDVVRRTLDEATAELAIAEPEARMAADAVGRDGEEPDPAVSYGPPKGPEPGTVAAGSDAPTSLSPGTATAAPERPLAIVVERSPAARLSPRPFDHADGSKASSSTRQPVEPRRRAERPPERDRPPMRPQTVADVAAARHAVAAPPVGPRPIPVPSPPVPSPPVVAPAPAGAAMASPPHPSPVDPVASEQALAARDDLLDDVEVGLTRALKRVLQDEQNGVLDDLRRLGPSEMVLPGPDAHMAAYCDAAGPWLQQATRAGAQSVPGAHGQVGHPSIEADPQSLAAELVEPLRERLLRVLVDAAGAGDPAVVGESVRAVYRQWKVQRMEDSARHHSVTAFALGAFAATPSGAVLRWLVDDDGHCPDCDDNALAGPTPKGQPYPTGQLHPPAHRGCRCLLVPAPA